MYTLHVIYKVHNKLISLIVDYTLYSIISYAHIHNNEMQSATKFYVYYEYFQPSDNS